MSSSCVVDHQDREEVAYFARSETNFYIPVTYKTFDRAVKRIKGTLEYFGTDQTDANWYTDWDHIRDRVPQAWNIEGLHVRYEYRPVALYGSNRAATAPEVKRAVVDLTTAAGVTSFMQREESKSTSPLFSSIVMAQHIFEPVLAFVANGLERGVNYPHGRTTLRLYHAVNQAIAYSISMAGFDVGRERERTGNMGIRMDETECYIVYCFPWVNRCITESIPNRCDLRSVLGYGPSHIGTDIMPSQEGQLRAKAFGATNRLSADYPLMDQHAWHTTVPYNRVMKAYSPLARRNVCMSTLKESPLDMYAELYEIVMAWYSGMCDYVLHGLDYFPDGPTGVGRYASFSQIDPVLSQLDVRTRAWHVYAYMRPPPELQEAMWRERIDRCISEYAYGGFDRDITNSARALQRVPPFARYRMLYAEIISHMTERCDSLWCYSAIDAVRRPRSRYLAKKLLRELQMRYRERCATVVLSKGTYNAMNPGDVYAYMRMKTNMYVTNLIAQYLRGEDVITLRNATNVVGVRRYV
jgi:hypothetical protein